MVIHSILYLNAHLFEYTLPAFFYRKVLYNDASRREKICAHIRSNNYDLVALSEVWSDKSKRMISGNLSDVYPHRYILKKTGPCYKVGPEHIILSKEPVSDLVYNSLVNLSGYDKYSDKQIYGFRIGNQYYCGTHFDTGCQNQNTQQLVEFINRNSNGLPTVIMGDFNISETRWNVNPNVIAPEYVPLNDSLTSIGFRDATRILSPNFVTDPSYTVNSGGNPVTLYFCNGNNTHKVRIDYFFVRDIQPISVEVLNLPLSDHNGIVLHI